jgi:hypothetical protein
MRWILLLVVGALEACGSVTAGPASPDGAAAAGGELGGRGGAGGQLEARGGAGGELGGRGGAGGAPWTPAAVPACTAKQVDWAICPQRIPDPTMPNNPNAGWQCDHDCSDQRLIQGIDSHGATTYRLQVGAVNLAAAGGCFVGTSDYCVPPAADGGDPCAACPR